MALSVVAAAGVAYAVRQALPDELRVRTDVVGHPIHADFNVYGYFHTFYAAALLFPALAFAFDALAARVLQRQPWWRRPEGPAEPLPAWEPAPGHLARVAGLLAHAIVLGAILGAGVAWRWDPTHFRRDVVLGTAATAVGVLVGTGPWQRAPRLALVARVGALAAPLVFLSVAAGVSVSRVQQVPSDTLRRVDWLPVWLPLLAALVGTGWVARRLRSTPPDEVLAFERRAFLGFVVPVGIFLFLSRVPGPLGPLDAYHEGEALGAVDLLRYRDLVPWRELFFIHGALTDIVKPAVGMFLVEYSRWGSLAGVMLLWMPIYFVAQFFLLRYLVGRNWALLLGATAAFVNGYLYPGDLRFLLHPFVLLAVAALLRRPSAGRALLFSAVAVVQWLLTPESAFLLAACACTIVAFELYYRSPGEGWATTLRRTRWCAGWTALLLLAWVGILAATGTLSSFVLYFRTFAPSHELTGGIPFHDDLPFVWFVVVAPVVAAVVTVWWFGAAFRTGRRLFEQDWVALAIALFTFLYYRKFLSRADGHVYAPYGQALPLIVYVAARTIDGSATWLSRWEALRRRGLPYLFRAAAALALVAGLVAPHATDLVRSYAQDLPTAFQAHVPDAVPHPLLGYTQEGAVNTVLLDDLRTTLEQLNPDDGQVFDMSNGPLLFHYILRQRPISRYFHVSLAIRHHTQQDALRFLRTERPIVVIMDGSMGLPSWDGVPNAVRHYDISAFVLDRYRPVIASHNYLFFLRNDVPTPDIAALAGRLSQAKTTDLLADAHPCDWGHAPRFFTDPSWRRGGRAVPLHLRHQTTLVVVGWAQDGTGGLPGEVVAALGENVVGTGALGGSRPDVAASTGSPQLATSGFEVAASVPDGTSPDSVELYAISADGRAVRLGRSSNLTTTTGAVPQHLRMPDGRSLSVVPGTGGSVDAVTVRHATVATFPDAVDPTAFTHLEVGRSSGFGADRFDIIPMPGSNPISFATDREDGKRYTLRVDNCPMWGLARHSITITSAGNATLDAVTALE
jgi:hypothetical protein